ncbi:MAG: hypothetical protein KJN84_12380 [Bacteroidia bacterium]|nr:hypothetical protein [Bacteroidia bacterium]
MDTKSSSLRVIQIISVIFAAIWIIAVGLDYFNKHPNYYVSFQYFKYPKLALFVVSTILILIWHYHYDKRTSWKIPVSGLTIGILGFIFSASIAFAHKDYSFTDTSMTQVFSHLGWTWSIIAFLWAIFMILHSFGQYLFRMVLKKHLEENMLLNIAFGIMAFVFVLFTVGVFKALSPNAVLFILFVFALPNLFDLVKSFKSVLFKPIDISTFNPIGIFAFAFIVFFLILNFQSSIGPFPTGFDSRNFYINISKLISDNGSLVTGFQPYNWSIFMAAGFLLFDTVELSLAISFIPVVLVLMASYQLGNKLLKIDGNKLMLVLAVFIVTPAITNQMTVELKADFGMLFFQVLILYYAIQFFVKVENLTYGHGVKTNVKLLMPLIVLIGVLSGFALGIKMINMFLVFALLILLWWDSKNKVAVLGILCFSLTLFLLTGIDDLSGLSKYHLGSDVIKYGLLLVALVALIYSFIKFYQRTTLRLVVTTIYLFITGLMIVPWMIKNYSETKSLDPNSLMMGKEPGPNKTLNQMIRKYERSKKN